MRLQVAERSAADATLAVDDAAVKLSAAQVIGPRHPWATACDGSGCLKSVRILSPAPFM